MAVGNTGAEKIVSVLNVYQFPPCQITGLPTVASAAISVAAGCDFPPLLKAHPAQETTEQLVI